MCTQVVVPGPAKTTMTRDFTFHACLGPDVMQPDVLTLCGVPQLLDAALAGYNVTIFAYGQTGQSGPGMDGSGKPSVVVGREKVGHVLRTAKHCPLMLGYSYAPSLGVAEV